MDKPTISNLISAIQTGSSKISIRRDYFPSKYLAYLKTEIGGINNQINIVELVETENAEKEKERWLELARTGRFENPSFTYNQDKLEIVANKEARVFELLELLYEHSPFDLRERFEIEMLQYLIQDLLLSIEIAKSILARDDEKTAKIVRKKFGEIPFISRDFNFKKEEVEEVEYPEKSFNAEAIQRAFYIAQRCYGWSWPISVSENAVAIDVRDKSSTSNCIFIPKSRNVSSTQLLRLVGHEIESHQRSSMNGQRLFGFGGLSMKTDNEELYEGLAMLSDRDFDLWKYGSYRNETAKYYVQTIKMASSGMSFGEVARMLYQMRRHENNALIKSYNMTRRVFRGITDTNNPAGYAFTKDLGYYNGLKMATELENKGLSWLLELGSFDLNQLMIIAKYFRLSPEVIPYQKIDLKTDPNFLESLGIN